MSDRHIIFSPERNQWTLTDGRHHMEVPEWAREIMRDEFERETRPLQAENDRLRERITTQKQTIQSYRDESREWREVADHAQADNAKLRELVRDMYEMAYPEFPSAFEAAFADRMRELGVEVVE